METTDLGSALVAFVADIVPGLLLLIGIGCRLLGLGLFLVGALRLLRHASQAMAPSALGTALSFLGAAVLMALPAWLDGAGESLFGSARHATVLGYGGDVPGVGPLIDAVFTIVAIIGLAAFIRGVFVLRAAADGHPGATAGVGAMHLVGGAAAWHMTALVGALQTTLGIRILDIS